MSQPPVNQPPQVIYVKQKRGRGCLYAVIVIIVLVIAGAAIYSQQKQSGALAFTVTYKVTGTAKAPTVSYNNQTGGLQQATVQLPWQQSYNFTDGVYFGSLIVTNSYQDTGSVTCQILVGSKIVKTSTSSGSLATTSCSGSFSAADGK